MANATDQQVQNFCDTRVRIQAEAARALALAFDDSLLRFAYRADN